MVDLHTDLEITICSICGNINDYLDLICTYAISAHACVTFTENDMATKLLTLKSTFYFVKFTYNFL